VKKHERSVWMGRESEEALKKGMGKRGGRE